MEFPCLDLGLAHRIELAEAEKAVDGVMTMKELGSDIPSAVEDIAGGHAIYCGAESPVTQALALGLNGPVSAEEFDRLEAFYFSRKETVRVETCPLADETLMGHYRQRGYYVTEFTNVMVRPIGSNELWSVSKEVEIRRASREELELWALTVSQGFSDEFPVTQELLSVMKMFALGGDTECYLARIAGRVVGGATFALRGKIGGFFGASTLPEFRKRGVQTALLHTRLQRAAEVGCDLAVSLARPGSTSQRNITRQGFRTLYTRVKFERPFEAG